LLSQTVESPCNTDTCYTNLARGLRYSLPDSAISLCLKVTVNTNALDSNLHDAYELMGDAYWHKGELTSSITNYQTTLDYAKKLNDPEKISRSYSNIGYLYMDIGENDLAVKNLNTSIAIAEKHNLTERKIIAKVYLAQAWGVNKQYDKAIKLQKELLEFRLKAKDSISIAVILNNISNNYTRAGILDSSLVYIKEALHYDEKLNRKKEIINDMMNLSEVYYGLENYEESFKYISKSLQYMKEENLGEDYLMSAYAKLSKIHAKQNEYEKAKHYIELTLKLLPAETSKKRYADIYGQTSDTYKNMGEIDSAYKYLKLYTIMNDSIYIEENAEKIAQMEAKLELSTKNKEIKNLNADKILKEIVIENQLLQRNMLIVVAILILFFLAIIFNRLKVTRKQKTVIEEQKTEVEQAHFELEEKNQEIMDSIAYAKRIQSAILPPNKVVKEYLDQSFILYKPKDVVAGDFYWLEHKDNKVLFAAADCTGHGVPGAMVSVVCNNALNRSVREHGLTDPGQILDKTREIVIQEFEKSEEDVKDGMDIALCSLQQMAGGYKLKYAGAHNPLWIITSSLEGGKEVGEKSPLKSHFGKLCAGSQGDKWLVEIKANKQPIGKFDNPEPYTTHTFELETGDSIYIFSDGYVDQFGGEKGKKFKARAFRELLLSIQDQSMTDQKVIIDKNFENWKGNLEQIDDVCVIGVRI